MEDKDFLRELGVLAFFTRLKRISDTMAHDGRRMYKELGMGIEPNWFVIFKLLQKHETLGVTEIADRIGLAHPSVISIVNKMIKAGYLGEERDAEDNRRRMLRLTDKALRELPDFERIWAAGTAGFKRMMSDMDVFSLLDAVEDRLSARGFRDRTLDELKEMPVVSVVPYDEKFAEYFGRLNYEWIEKSYTIEKHDREVLDNPRGSIIERGGEIFFALVNDEPAGTVALIPMGENDLELTKMAVSPEHRGLSIGDRLMAACIEWGMKQGKDSLILESNTKQVAAIRLYRKFGFVEIPLDPNTEYARANIRMRLEL